MYLNGNMYLCARADGDASRYFSGSVAQASFYNEALNASSIMVGRTTTVTDVMMLVGLLKPKGNCS